MRFLVFLLLLTGFASPVDALSRNWRDCINSDPDRSIRGCTRIIKRGKDTRKNLGIAYSNRGNAYANKGQWDLAARNYQQYLKFASKPDANDHNRAAWAWFKAGEAAKGLKDAEVAVVIDPDYYAA